MVPLCRRSGVGCPPRPREEQGVTVLELDQLREDVAGDVVAPGDEGYDEVRKVYNEMIDRRPAVVVRCSSTSDVVAAVNLARENGLDLAVRGGGHSVPGFGTCDDGVVIDLSGMRTVTVDATSRTARAEGGATWGDFNDATHAHGLATTGGIISTTGVGGLTLGGGIGYLARAFGLSCDNLLSAEVVTADGRSVLASEDENADLFWALRGGGGNFGVVTSFEFRLHPVETIYGGPMFFEVDDAATVLRFYREFIADAPEEFGGFPAWQIAPPLPFIPEDRHGDPFLAFVACWAGPLDQGEAMLKPLHDVAPVVAEHVGEMPYPALNSAFDALVPPGTAALLEGELRDRAERRHGRRPRRAWTEGARGQLDRAHLSDQRRVPPGLPRRDSLRVPRREFRQCDRGDVADPSQNEANTRWVRDYYDATAPLSEEGGYINFMAGDDQDRIKANYRGNYDRLVQVKRTYDPDNLFHLNQNIRP